MDLEGSLRRNEEAATLKCTGGGVEWGVWGFRWRESVAKPLVLIRTTIFFFPPSESKRGL